MKTLFFYIKQFLKQHYNFLLYFVYAVMLSLLIFGYYYDIGNWNSIYTSIFNSPFLLFIFLISFYYLFCFIQSLIKRKYKMYGLPMFWVSTLFAFALFAFNKTFTLKEIIHRITPKSEFKYIYIVFVRSFNFVTLIIPLIVFYNITKKHKQNNFYGLQIHGVHWKMYLSVLPFLILIIFFSSFQSNLLYYYPRFENSGYNNVSSIPNWLGILIFEVSYAIYYIRVELFFRGFLVLGIEQYLQKDAILPMVSVYCLLHLGKPMEEAITAIFGGYILGIIAYYSKNIFGGVVWHISIAWLMELFAHLNKHYF